MVEPSTPKLMIYRDISERVTLRVVSRGVLRAGVERGRRVVEGVRLRRLAARPHEQLHAHRLGDVRAAVCGHAAY